MAKRKKIKRKSAIRRQKTITTRRGMTFRAFNKEIPVRSHKIKRGTDSAGLGRYFDEKIRPHFRQFYKENRRKGRTQYSFRVRTRLKIKGDKIEQYISSLRTDIIIDEELEETLDRFRRDFVEFIDKYLMRKSLAQIEVDAASMETLYTPLPPRKRKTKPRRKSKQKPKRKTRKKSKQKPKAKKRAGKSKKVKRRKSAKKKTLRGRRHRKHEMGKFLSSGVM